MTKFLQSRIFLLLMLSGLFVSCAGGEAFRFAFSRQEPDQVRSRIQTDVAAISSFTGTASITLDTPEQSGRIRGEVEIAPFQSATVRIQHPFGGYLGTLELEKERLMYFDPAGNIQYIGSIFDAGIPGLPAFFTGGQNLIVVLTGLLNLPDNPEQTLITDSLAADLQIFGYEIPTLQRTYWYDPHLRRIVKYVEYNSLSKIETRIELENFVEMEGMNLPRTITVIQANERRMLSLHYQDIQIAKQPSQANAL